jgi:transketolase
VAIDYNKWQATGRSNEVLALAPLADKWRAFGWCVTEVDGHNFAEIAAAQEAHADDPRPKVLIAHTIKGHGVSFMEDDNNWHYRTPNTQEVLRAAIELGIDAADVRIEGRAAARHE